MRRERINDRLNGEEIVVNGEMSKDDASRWEVSPLFASGKRRKRAGAEKIVSSSRSPHACLRFISHSRGRIANRFHGERTTRSGLKEAEIMRRPPGIVQRTLFLILLLAVYATSAKQPHIIFILADDLASYFLRFTLLNC